MNNAGFSLSLTSLKKSLFGMVQKTSTRISWATQILILAALSLGAVVVLPAHAQTNGASANVQRSAMVMSIINIVLEDDDSAQGNDGTGTGGGALAAVSIVNPISSAVLNTDAPQALTAVSSSGAQAVKFFGNGTLLGSAAWSGTVWQLNWVPAAAGNVVLVARAYDAAGKELGSSAPIQVSVNAVVAGQVTPVPVTVEVPQKSNPLAGSLPGGAGRLARWYSLLLDSIATSAGYGGNESRVEPFIQQRR